MLVAFVGIVLIMIGIGVIGESAAPLIIGIVLFLLGMMGSEAMSEHNRARMNYRRYWAYGEEPDWKRNRK